MTSPMQTDGSPSGALHKMATALRRQVEDTRQQLQQLQRQRDVKERLIQTGWRVLGVHCAAKLSSTGPLQASMTVEPTPRGWTVTVRLENLPADFPFIGAQASVLVVHPSISCASTPAIAPTDSSGEGEALAAAAEVRMQSTAATEALAAPAQVFALLQSPEGQLLAVVPAGKLDVDPVRWLQQVTTEHSSNSSSYGSGGNQGEALQLWAFSAEMVVSCSRRHAASGWISHTLLQIERCTMLPQRGLAEGGKTSWEVGDGGALGEVSYSSTTALSGAETTAITVCAPTKPLLAALQLQVLRGVRVAAASEETKIQVIEGARSGGELSDSGQKAVLRVLDAVLDETKALGAWIEALKEERSAEEAAVLSGSSLAWTADARTAVDKAQTSAVHAMIKTDSTVAPLLE